MNQTFLIKFSIRLYQITLKRGLLNVKLKMRSMNPKPRVSSSHRTSYHLFPPYIFQVQLQHNICKDSFFLTFNKSTKYLITVVVQKICEILAILFADLYIADMQN